jgi:hypothetical protein
MARFAATTILGPGSYVNADPTAARRVITELRAKLASGTRVKQFTQGETLMGEIESIFITCFPTASDGAVAADIGSSLDWIPSVDALSNGKFSTGTVVVKEASKTLTRISRIHVLLIGTPDPLRAGSP